MREKNWLKCSTCSSTFPQEAAAKNRLFNPAFDKAMEDSKVADKTAHFAALHEAEKIVSEDYGFIPVAYYNDFWLQSTSLKGTWHSPYGYWYLQYAYLAD